MGFPDIVPRTMSSAAVKVVGANKCYQNGHPILSNLNMRVQQGTIYVLIGASGCGKTTLLSCIVGLRKLDSGDIRVFGAKPGTEQSGIPGKTIGYMPQDIALYDIFTIEEILSYFGRIYGMSKIEIEARTQFLVSFLSLPETSSCIKNLSGGQQRRTSLAVAMIHQPELLILDEPTVGVDPLLRENIWKHLSELVVKRETTVIITTHYIEEARHSDTIGVMRHGHLLAERNPRTLLLEHGTIFLSDVVLKLSKDDTNAHTQGVKNVNQEFNSGMHIDLAQVLVEGTKLKEKTEPNVIGIKYQKRSPDYNTLNFKQESQIQDECRLNLRNSPNKSIHVVAPLLKRNLLMHFRQPVFVLVQLILPVLQIILFNFIVGSDPYGLRIAVINNELTPLPLEDQHHYQNFLEYCDHQSRRGGCFKEALSCGYFNTFKNGEIDWYPVKSEEEALEQVTSGLAMGYLSFPSNFTKQMQDKFLLRNFATSETLQGSTISGRLDLSNKLNTGHLIKGLYERYLEFIQDIATDCGQDPRLASVPLKYNAIYGSEKGGWTEFLQPAFVSWIIFMMPMGIGIFYVSDKKAGTLDRTMVAGVKFHHLLISLMISEGAILVLQLMFCFFVLIFLFGFTVTGSLSLCIILCYLIGMIGVACGVLLGTFCNQEMEVIMIMACINMFTVASSGGMWPLAAIISWWQPFSYFIPVTIPLESIRSVVSRGWGLSHPVVWQGLLVTIGWILLGCMLSGVVHRFKK